MATTTTTATEGWKTGSLIEGPGIPAPTGEYQVGSTQLVHKFDDEEHSLLVTLFYPCQSGGDYEYVPACPHKKYSEGYLNFLKTRFTENLDKLATIEIRLPALNGAPLFKGESRVFPVIVFSHGLGGTGTGYGGICCDAASHGYVVASVQHRDGSAAVSRIRVPGGKEGEWVDEWLPFVDNWVVNDDKSIDWFKTFPSLNKQVKQRAVDCKRALDLLGLLNEGSPVGNLLGSNVDFTQFKGRLNWDTVGIMGHSFGGSSVIQTLSEDPRFKCGVCLDTWMIPIHPDLYKNGSVVKQPMIFINSYDFQFKENVQFMTMMTKPPNEQGMSKCRIVTLIGTNHYNQTDLAFLFLPTGPYGEKFRTPLDPLIPHQVNLDIMHAFFKRHMLNDPAYQGPIPNLDGSDGHSPHILFGTNVNIEDAS